MEETFHGNPYEDDDQAEEDTLSLSDLPIYGENGDSQDFRVEDQSDDYLDAKQDDDGHFEFSSDASSTFPPHNTIVFCGRIIPYKEPSGVSHSTHRVESKKQQKCHKRSVSRWRFIRFFKKSSSSTSSESNTGSEKRDGKYEIPIRRVSILASATKSRWYLFMFGYGSTRLSSEMHIRDLRKRQTSSRSKCNNHSGDGGSDGKLSSGGGCGGCGMESWGLIRLLGCGGGDGGDQHHPNAIVKLGGV